MESIKKLVSDIDNEVTFTIELLHMNDTQAAITNLSAIKRCLKELNDRLLKKEKMDRRIIKSNQKR